MSKAWLSATASGYRLDVQVSPNGKKSEILEASDDILRIRLQAPPVDGKANEALIRFVAERCGLPKSRIRLTHGLSSRKKRLAIESDKLTLPEMEKIFSAS
ncbi:MAG: DUF167 domain-containing protein [Alistipes senegalensis]|nr:DUF167 domain-containing protein [Oxalobacter formigenes]MCM1280370.1 DUF167 domain-containing protein [Alistipes senegalensis]